MNKKHLVLYSLIAVVLIVAVYFIYPVEDISPGPEYLSFYPESPLIQVEAKGLKKMPEAIQKLEIVEKSEQTGLKKEIRSRFGEVFDDSGMISTFRDRFKNNTESTPGRFSLGVIQDKSGNLQLLAVVPFSDELNFSEDKLNEGKNQLPEFIRKDWLDETDKNIIYETSTVGKVKIHKMKKAETPNGLQLSFATTGKFLLLGLGGSVLPDALERYQTPSPTDSVLGQNDSSPEIALKFDHRFFEALVTQVENFTSEEYQLKGRVSFSGLRQELSELLAGIRPVRSSLNFQNGRVVVETDLDYDLEKLHPFLEYFMKIEPTELRSANYFGKNTVSVVSRRLPNAGELYVRLADAIVDIANAGAGEEVEKKVNQSISLGRTLLPEQEIKEFLNTIKGEVAFGTILSTEEAKDKLTPSALTGNTLVALKIGDYEDFATRLEAFNSYELFDFNKKTGRVQFTGVDLNLFIKNHEDWVLISDQKEVVEKSKQNYKSGNNLSNYEPFLRVRGNTPDKLSGFAYYSLKPYGKLLKNGTLTSKVPEKFKDFYSGFEPKVARLARELPPTSIVTVNKPRQGHSQTTLRSPGGTMFFLGILNALSNVDKSQGGVMEAINQSKISEAKSNISVVRTAFVQCQLSEECNSSGLDESWSDYLPEKFWADSVSPRLEIYVEDENLKAIYLHDVGTKWEDEAGNSGRGMIWTLEDGRFYAHSSRLEDFEKLNIQ